MLQGRAVGPSESGTFLVRCGACVSGAFCIWPLRPRTVALENALCVVASLAARNKNHDAREPAAAVGRRGPRRAAAGRAPAGRRGRPRAPAPAPESCVGGVSGGRVVGACGGAPLSTLWRARGARRVAAQTLLRLIYFTITLRPNVLRLQSVSGDRRPNKGTKVHTRVAPGPAWPPRSYTRAAAATVLYIHLVWRALAPIAVQYQFPPNRRPIAARLPPQLPPTRELRHAFSRLGSTSWVAEGGGSSVVKYGCSSASAALMRVEGLKVSSLPSSASASG